MKHTQEHSSRWVGHPLVVPGQRITVALGIEDQIPQDSGRTNPGTLQDGYRRLRVDTPYGGERARPRLHLHTPTRWEKGRGSQFSFLGAR